MGASSNRACAMCPTVAMGEARPLLLGHHSSDETAAVDHLPVATEGYGPFLQRRIVVVVSKEGSETDRHYISCEVVCSVSHWIFLTCFCTGMNLS
jgi:hypothetical protein